MLLHYDFNAQSRVTFTYTALSILKTDIFPYFLYTFHIFYSNFSIDF